ncbi:MAG: M23 family metallopeptidase, partial [Burkholderiales bacterium]
YALDIDRLNRWGMIADGILPKELSRYAIFGTRVVSPCDGEVKAAVDGLPDLIPPETDRKNSKGNHVLIRCPKLNVDVLLAHLQRGSLERRAGERVVRGQTLELVGNSGNTSRPHLHLQASRDGEGIAMTFNGRFLARNALVTVE